VLSQKSQAKMLARIDPKNSKSHGVHCMSVFRDLIKDAIDADLGKNAQKVINTLLHQTIGFGKPTDPLTDKRIARISGVRLDRVRLAIHEVMETHIFFRVPHDKFQWCYSIGQRYLDAHQKRFE
jgi:phage replication O-like protein O